ncbi:hypothetical protein [Lysinibacillus sp. FSL W7-1291]|uniref:hypothetical protein n=1 Tax=Lysinibacillus sp. FSL W7-1291 TaxID=2954544 RepID=UPI00315AF9FB
MKHLENYKVTDDTVYVSSYSKVYNHLTNQGRLLGYNLTEYLWNEFGLKRMEHKDLPDGYIPFELGDSEENLDKEEHFFQYIESNLMLDEDESYFYIDSSTKFYGSILKYCNLIGISVEAFFEKWELIRLSYNVALKYLIDELAFSEEEAVTYLNRVVAEYSDSNELEEDAEEKQEDKDELDHESSVFEEILDEEIEEEEVDAEDEPEVEGKSDTTTEDNSKEESTQTTTEIDLSSLDDDSLLRFLDELSNDIVNTTITIEKRSVLRRL